MKINYNYKILSKSYCVFIYLDIKTKNFDFRKFIRENKIQYFKKAELYYEL